MKNIISKPQIQNPPPLRPLFFGVGEKGFLAHRHEPDHVQNSAVKRKQVNHEKWNSEARHFAAHIADKTEIVESPPEKTKQEKRNPPDKKRNKKRPSDPQEFFVGIFDGLKLHRKFILSQHRCPLFHGFMRGSQRLTCFLYST